MRRQVRTAEREPCAKSAGNPSASSWAVVCGMCAGKLLAVSRPEEIDAYCMRLKDGESGIQTIRPKQFDQWDNSAGSRPIDGETWQRPSTLDLAQSGGGAIRNKAI